MIVSKKSTDHSTFFIHLFILLMEPSIYYIILIYLTLQILFSWHDEILSFWHQPHEPNLHIICIVVFLFVSK